MAAEGTEGSAQTSEGQTLSAFTSALWAALALFGVQMLAFQLLRNKMARIYKPKLFMVPQRERTDKPPPPGPVSLLLRILRLKDRDIIRKCGLDAYFFLRYLQMLLVVFVPIALVAIPTLVPLNYVGGLGQEVVGMNETNRTNSNEPQGLDTLAWGNIRPANHERRWAHLALALAIIAWVCYVCFVELRIYIKVRQDYLTSASHRLRASANTVLVNSIPEKWLTEEALRGLFDVFPQGIRNVWITRDFTKLLDKVHKRDKIRLMLEEAQSDLIRDAKSRQLKQRKAKEKKEAKAGHKHKRTKQEEQAREEAEDMEAKRRAESDQGISAGDHEHVPDMEDVHSASREGSLRDGKAGPKPGGFKTLGSKVGQGFGKAGQGMMGAGKAINRGIGGQLGHTAGFDLSARLQAQDGGHSSRPGTSDSYTVAGRSSDAVEPTQFVGNTTRKATNLDDMILSDDRHWWQFWKPPTGGYASPIPQGFEGDEFPLTEISKEEKKKLREERQNSQQKTFWGLVKGLFAGSDDGKDVEYPVDKSAFEYTEEMDADAEWHQYKVSRPTHFLPKFGWTPAWLPGVWGFNKKVDTIRWCRGELARLNMEIEEDQKHPERYPVMKSAFIQFNSQLAAHMACQSVTHHVPRQMGPRMVEVSPNDVIWENMAIGWASEWMRTAIVLAIVVGMVVLWAIPVAFTSGLSQIDALIKWIPFLAPLQQNPEALWWLQRAAGILPPVLLAILLWVVPIIFNGLAHFQGVKTGAQKAEWVQIFYFAFLFTQVFLVVSIASGAVNTVTETIADITSVPTTLAKNLPKAANYFFSYMILQAMSVSSGTLLQLGTLLVWFAVAPLFDNTARAKWARQVELPVVHWGTFFPVYTNFACIALIYAVVAPLISLFAILTFSLLWLAHRYNMVYVTRFQTDTGGVLYPRAINQLFTGLYVMELCLAGLFFISEDEDGVLSGYVQGVVMIVALGLTVLYQVMLNWSFGPLLRYLPITFEDEAVLRDQAFQREQERLMGIQHSDSDSDEDGSVRGGRSSDAKTDEDPGRYKLSQKDRTGTGGSSRRGGMLNPVVVAGGIKQAGSWAVKGSKQIGHKTFGKAAEYRKRQRDRDLEAQRAMGEALFGGYHDEIEDLTPSERDMLVREAFKHQALRARRPAVWIPRDDIGVSDGEILRTKAFSHYIWMSNEGTALDSKVRVVYGRPPPDFSEVDLILL